MQQEINPLRNTILLNYKGRDAQVRPRYPKSFPRIPGSSVNVVGQWGNCAACHPPLGRNHDS